MDAGVGIWILAAVATAAGMEPWAAFLHGRLWHGPLWNVHASHHTDGDGGFEANDVFAFLHAPPAMVLIIGACLSGDSWLDNLAFGVGIGMTVFGAAYAVVHDGLAHGRLPVGFLARFETLRRIRGAHMAHHKTGAAPYGLFLGPRELRATRR